MSLYLGMMSGTSMDAIDASLVDFDVKPLRILASSATPFEPALKERLAALIESPERVALDELGQVDVALAQAFANAATALLGSAGVSAGAVAAIGSHGQTIRHRPDLPLPFTLQIGDPNTLAEMTGITVVGDFRRRDVAAGGQGAPLLPVFHDQVFRSDEEDRVILNLGGIANVTVLRRDCHRHRLRHRPRNRLLDAWIARHQGREFDADGGWAGTGRCDATLLEQLLDEPYLKLAPPKSTGPRTVQYSLAAEQTGVVRAAAGGRAGHPAGIHRGERRGRHAPLRARRGRVRVRRPAPTTRDCSPLWPVRCRRIRCRPPRLWVSIPTMWRAVAFAWFAQRTLEGLTSSAGSVTGARGARILGGVYRYA